MKPEIDFVEFVTVVGAGSFSGAALKLGVSKSHVSKQVTRLERRLGVQLLRRSTRRLDLTEVGRVYYERCARILDDIRESELMIFETQSIPQGVINLSLPNTFGEHFIVPIIGEFMLKHRQLRVNANVSTRNADLLEEGIDLAIRIGDPPDSRLVARNLCVTRWIVCGSPEYLAHYGIPEHPNDLQMHPCLIFSLYGIFEDAIWTFQSQNKAEKYHVPGVFCSNDGNALIGAVRKGVGLVYLPEIFVAEDLARGELSQVLGDWSLPTVISAVYPYSRHLSQKIRTLIDFLLERLAI